MRYYIKAYLEERNIMDQIAETITDARQKAEYIVNIQSYDKAEIYEIKKWENGEWPKLEKEPLKTIYPDKTKNDYTRELIMVRLQRKKNDRARKEKFN
ncbi:MAG: hypothetical protein PUB18_00960 [bacterium]|nr:hypothetical protein [bacterium]